MEKILALCAIICALMFGFSLALLQKEKVSKQSWRIAVKLFTQVSAAVSYLCVFFSIYVYEQIAQRTESVPRWEIAIISIAPVGIFATIGYILPNAYQKVIHIIKHGIKETDTDFLLTCISAVAIMIAGCIAESYFRVSIPILMYPVIVLIQGILIVGVVVAFLVFCYIYLREIIYFFKNAKKICKGYWSWLTN